MVEQLRRRGYSIVQSCVTLLYGLLVIAAFAAHGIWYEERAEAYFDRRDLGSDLQVQWVLFITELALLGFFAIDFVLHMVGYGGLYLRKVQTITELICLVANAVVVSYMMSSVVLS